MKIKQVVLYHLDMPLAHPFKTSFGLETRRQCLIIAASGEGLTGWGECVALDRPAYSSETVGTAWHILEEYLVPAVLETDWEDIEGFLNPLSWVRGNPMARAALQSAAWDLLAQSQGLSLAATLAEPYPEGPRARVPVGVSIGIQPTIEGTLIRLDKFLSQGFSRIKLKIKPGWDLKLLREVRHKFPEIRLMVDANSAYRMDDLEILKAMDEFDLIMLEQPLSHDDVYQHSQLQKLIDTPICLDESIHSPDQAVWALKIGACRVINIKPGRVGGLWETRKIHDLCQDRGIPVWCGGMLETGIGRAANLAAASLPNFRMPTDNGPTGRYWEEDIIEEEFFLNREDSTITVPDQPGLGVTPSLDRIEKYLARKKTLAS
ncbi:MAG: o-succinylbenzoate synthase [Gammaproteobacteria bacterium]|nr:o-succinylbenzoate synthase [Gammaproteobacteria bacterium]